MNADRQSMLRHRAINGWGLFWLVAIPMSFAMLIKMTGVDLRTAPGVSEMIGYSVRWAVPFIYLVVAASALQKLFPGAIPAWLLRNRKYVGLIFAVAMAWQGLFIYIMSTLYRDYYFDEIYLLRDELEGSTGYLFLTAMVLTSFRFGARHLSPQQWKLLHTSGIYFLWAYPFSVYWWNLSYYENPQPIDYVFYWCGFLAFALRIAAWGKQRRRATVNTAAANAAALPALRTAGAVLIGFGLVVAASGKYWQDRVTALLTDPEWSANLELWLPFWPLEPFLSLIIIAIGTGVATMAGETATTRDLAAGRAD